MGCVCACVHVFVCVCVCAPEMEVMEGSAQCTVELLSATVYCTGEARTCGTKEPASHLSLLALVNGL